MKKSILNYLATFEQDCVPKGWHTAQQVANRVGRSKRTVIDMFAVLRKHKQLQERKFRIITNSGLKPVHHYKFTAKGNKAFGLD
jgi:hypothetical protein